MEVREQSTGDSSKGMFKFNLHRQSCLVLRIPPAGAGGLFKFSLRLQIGAEQAGPEQSAGCRRWDSVIRLHELVGGI